MYLGATATLTLDIRNAVIASAAGTEVDFNKYFVNPGKRPMGANVAAVWTGSDSGTATFDYKLQESATTVDSDFSDISGATITQLAADGAAASFQRINFYTAKRYVRGYATIAGGVWNIAADLLAVKRDA
jgi:hypothetical protein